MASQLTAEHALPDEKITVVPCCAEVSGFAASRRDRDLVRSELGLARRLVVTYCGSLAWYQRPDQSIRLFRLLHDLEPAAHFLAITTDRRRMQEELLSHRLPESQWTVLSLAASDVPRYLCASDIGLLLRDNTPVNRVASPVKFAEYMASGTPVLITDHIGDYSSAVRKEELGAIVNVNLPDEGLRERLGGALAMMRGNGEQIRLRCVSFAERNLCWDAYVPATIAAYQRVLRGVPSNGRCGGG